MDYERAYSLMDIEQRCVLRASDKRCDRDCEKCDLVQDSKELVAAYEYAKMALGSLRQVQWERDVALEQLNALGYKLGQTYTKEVFLTDDRGKDIWKLSKALSQYEKITGKKPKLYMNDETAHSFCMYFDHNKDSDLKSFEGYNVVIHNYNLLSDGVIYITE